MTKLKAVAFLIAVLSFGAGCAAPTNENATRATLPATTGVSVPGVATVEPAVAGPETTDTASAAPETTAAPSAAVDIRAVLGQLSIDDNPRPPTPYSRDDWSHWDDLDGNGCDTRQDVLLRDTRVAATTGAGCSVIGGDWYSIYDAAVAYTPGDFDIDHVVPLADAHASGGWRFGAEQRRQYANDMSNLIAVSAESNRTKSAQRPDEWRPAMQDSWCFTATTWVATKVKYSLTVTTSERDALGQMLETCGATPTVAPGGPAVTDTAPPVAPGPATTTAPSPGGGPVSYENCAAVRAAGAAPLHEGQPGYRSGLDGDKDGIACE